MPKSCGPAHYGFVLVGFAFIALIGAEVVLVTTIPGTSYDGADGKAAQAEILATLEFARPFEITNLNPLQGLWPQMMPMNVWVNPAYWPFAFFPKELAAEISGIVALICYAVACYLMARLFDLPRLPSIIAAQLSIMLFGVAARALAFSPVFVSIPGLAVVYAPHLLALGLLARVSPNRPRAFIIAAGILLLLFYSLYCDPLWTMVSGVAWIVPFGVVTFGPLHRDTILVRCAVLGGCVAVSLLSGALEYVYSLSQYTARVQFPHLLQRPRNLETTSVFFVSKYAKYFYWACAPGWALGIWRLRGRPRILVVAAAVSALAFLAYSTAYLHLEGNWWLLDGRNRRLLGWTGSAGSKRPPLDARSRRSKRWPPAHTLALAFARAGCSGDGDHGGGGCFHRTGRSNRQSTQIPEGTREILARGLAR
jgi:hypothetical protein